MKNLIFASYEKSQLIDTKLYICTGDHSDGVDEFTNLPLKLGTRKPTVVVHNIGLRRKRRGRKMGVWGLDQQRRNQGTIMDLYDQQRRNQWGRGDGYPPMMKKLVFEKHSNLPQNGYIGRYH